MDAKGGGEESGLGKSQEPATPKTSQWHFDLNEAAPGLHDDGADKRPGETGPPEFPPSEHPSSDAANGANDDIVNPSTAPTKDEGADKSAAPGLHFPDAGVHSSREGDGAGGLRAGLEGHNPLGRNNHSRPAFRVSPPEIVELGTSSEEESEAERGSGDDSESESELETDEEDPGGGVYCKGALLKPSFVALWSLHQCELL